MRERTGNRRHRRVLLAAVTAVAALTAACSSSKSNNNTGGGGGSTSAGDSAAIVQKAQDFIKPYLTPPTTIPLTESLKAPAVKGKTIVFLQCELAQCKGISLGVQAGAQTAGWNFKSIPYQSTKVLPSPDGHSYRCSTAGSVQGVTYCIYVPKGGA